MGKKNHSVNVGGKRHQAPDGKDWTPAALKGLALFIESTVPAGKKVKHRSHKIVHEIVSHPVVRDITITPSINVLFDTRDPISDGDYAINWDYFDPEKQKQVGFAINVFTNYQYIQPDFDVTDTSKTLWHYVSGVNDATSYNIKPSDGYVNGGQYWVFIRVAKEYNGKHYYSDWQGTSFNTTLFQPQPPMVAVYADNSKARNEIAITTSDNLFSADNGTFQNGKGGWRVTDNDSALSGINIAVTPTSLRTPLTNSKPISSLPIGAYGGLLDAIGAYDSSLKVTGSSSSAAPSHLSITGSITSGNNRMTVSSVNGIINGMAVIGFGIPNGTTVVSTSTNGTTSFYVNLSAKATESHTNYSYILNYYDATDAVGFPRSGQFWVQIDDERILVENLRNGNNTGDTFKVIERGYRGTTPASHSKGATVMYGLQQDIYSGWIGDIIQAYDTSEGSSSVNHHTRSVLRHSGTAASTTDTVVTTLLVASGKDGVANDSENIIYVNDPQNLLKAGQQITVQAWGDVTSTRQNVVGSGIHTVLKNTTTTSTQTTAYATAKITNVTGASVTQSQRVTIGDIEYDNVVPAGKSLSSLSIRGFRSIAANLPDQGAKGNTNTCYAIPSGIVPAGTTAYIVMDDSYYLPSTGGATDPTKQIGGGKSFPITLTAPVNVTPYFGNYIYFTTTMHFKPITNAGPFQYVTASGHVSGTFCFPAYAHVDITTDPVSALKKVTLSQSLNQGTMKGHTVRAGDRVLLTDVSYNPGTPASYGTESYTTPVKKVTHKSVDQTQTFVVGFNASARPSFHRSVTLGTWDGADFTPLASDGSVNSAIYNAVKITTGSSLLYTGYYAEIGGLPNGTTVVSTNSVTGGYVMFFGDGTTGVQPQDGLNHWRTTADATFYPTDYNLITSGGATPTMSVPVVPFFPKYNFLRHTSVKFYTKTVFGTNSMRVTAGQSGTSDIGIYSSDEWTNQNSIPVQAGVTYGFSALGTAFYGASSYPSMSLFIDWYDEFGNKLKISDGTESLSNPGQFNDFVNSAPLGTSLSANAGWSPWAIAALCPTIALSPSATYTATNTSHGYFTLPSNSNPALVAGSYITVNGSTIAVTDTQTNSSATTIHVGFPFGGKIADGAHASLLVRATRACPRISITTLDANDALGFCGLMFKALTPYKPSASHVALNTQLPALTATVSTNSGNYETGIPIPNTTPTAGEQTIYLLDPTNDAGTREIHFGAGTSSLVTKVKSKALAGDTSIHLGATVGLSVGSQITIGSGSTKEIVTVSSSWNGDLTVALTEPLVYKHNIGEIASAPSANITGHLSNTQTQGTKVAVFNWNNDGFINTPNTKYDYRAQRSDDLGVTYTTLFGGDNLVAQDTGIALINDVEVTPNGDTYYKVTPSFVDGKGNSISGAPITNLEAPLLNTNSWWIASSSDPDVRFPINVQNGVEETQKHPVGVFYPLGSSRPIIISGVVQGRDASITVIWTDNAKWDNFLNLLNLGETLVLTNPVEASKRYIAINDDVTVTHNAGGSPWRQVTIKYVEAPPPNGYGYTYGS